MMSRISDLEDAELCKRILAVVSVVYRPLTLDELETLVNMPAGASLREIIELCGSFLTLQNRIVSFVHQSAKEYLLKEAFDEIFPSEAPPTDSGYGSGSRTKPKVSDFSGWTIVWHYI
jgi:hypothetical protein